MLLRDCLVELLLQGTVHHSVTDIKLCFVTVGTVLCLGSVVCWLVVVVTDMVMLLLWQLSWCRWDFLLCVAQAFVWHRLLCSC